MKYKKVLYIFFVAILSVAIVHNASARRIAIGSNKGQEILDDGDRIKKNTETLNATLTKILNSQKEMNETMQKLIKNLEQQSKINQELLESTKESRSTVSPRFIPPLKSKDVSGLQQIELQKMTNQLLLKLLNEQKWLGATLQAYFKKEAVIGGKTKNR